MSNIKAATACINLDALKYNFNKIAEQSPGSKIVAIIKANAYGHGILNIANSIKQADAFGVARIEEALQLKSAGIVKPLLLLEGFYFPEDLDILSANNLHTAVHNIEQLEALEKANIDTPIKVWLKVDTGMHRLGIQPEEYDEYITRLNRCKNVQQPVNVMSHFASADDLDSPVTQQQIELFLSITKYCDGERSLAASAGILSWPESRLEWNRPGIILYGVSPFNDKPAKTLGYKPVMTLKSCLIAVRVVKAGEKVGYGGAWTCEKETKVGVIAVGYGDGYPRTAPNGTPVFVNGRIVPLVGRVSMDMLTVDLGIDAKDKVGDEAIMWGEELPAEDVSNHIGTIGYELVTKLTDRVEMIYLSHQE